MVVKVVLTSPSPPLAGTVVQSGTADSPPEPKERAKKSNRLARVLTALFARTL